MTKTVNDVSRENRAFRMWFQSVFQGDAREGGYFLFLMFANGKKDSVIWDYLEAGGYSFYKPDTFIEIAQAILDYQDEAVSK